MARLDDTRTRIVDAGIRCIVRDGVTATSMAAIAAEADVSKALLHYHFVDRGRLLAKIVAVLAERTSTREYLARGAGERETPIDRLWAWLAAEIGRGELRALLVMGTLKDPAVADAIAAAHQLRRMTAASSVARLFASLALAPRVQVELIADASVTFADGLVLSEMRDLASARVNFDVFWLAMLGLAD